LRHIRLMGAVRMYALDSIIETSKHLKVSSARIAWASGPR